MESIEKLKEQLKLLQEIISAYEILNELKEKSNSLDSGQYPLPIYSGTGTTFLPPWDVTCGNTAVIDKNFSISYTN